MGKIRAEKWRNIIESMLKFIPSINKTHFHYYCHSIDSKLSVYECLTEAASLLELALWKAATSADDDFDPHHVDHGADKLKYRMNCGASVVIPHVLSFLLNVAIDNGNADDQSDDDDEYPY